MEKNIQFESGLYYHEILKANSDTVLFKEDEDRKFFLKKMRNFILPCCELLSYVILGNHVHLIIRPHPPKVLSRLSLHLHLLDLDLYASDMKDYLSDDFSVKLPNGLMPFEGSVDKQIRYCILGLKHSYSHYQANKYERRGMQWTSDKLTKLLATKEDIGRTVLYIHNNPVYHGMVHQPEEWQFSSFHEIVNETDELVNGRSIQELFGSKDNFLNEHVASIDDFGRKPSKMKRLSELKSKEFRVNGGLR